MKEAMYIHELYLLCTWCRPFIMNHLWTYCRTGPDASCGQYNIYTLRRSRKHTKFNDLFQFIGFFISKNISACSNVCNKVWFAHFFGYIKSLCTVFDVKLEELVSRRLGYQFTVVTVFLLLRRICFKFKMVW